MELITINRLELASNLALKQVCLNNDIQEDELFDTAENGDKNIKECYQDEFNDLYDEYLDMIYECRERDEKPFEAKRFPMEFEFDGEFYSFDIHPTEPEWNTSIEIEDDVFNILYSEENNLVRVSRQDDALPYFEELVAYMPIKKEEQKRLRVEFMWKGFQSFDIQPTAPDWWTSHQIGEDMFDIHYCEDYNQIAVYLVQKNIPDYKHAVTRIPIRKEGSHE